MKRRIQKIHSPGTGDYDLIWKKSLGGCDHVKDLPTGSSWVIQVGPKSNGRGPDKRKQREIRWRRGGGLACGTQPRLEGQSHNREHQDPPGSWKREGKFSPLEFSDNAGPC